MRKWRAASSSGKRFATRRVIARTQARVSRSLRSTGVRSFTAWASVARTDAERTSYCCAPATVSPPQSIATAEKARLRSLAPRIGERAGHELRRLGGGDLRRLRVAAMLVLESAFLEPALADHHAMRDAHQLLVGEEHARALVAIVEEGLDAGGLELGVQLVRGRAHRFAAAVSHGDDRDRERRHGIGPDDAALVVVLLDRRGHDARDADPVAA